MAKPGSFADRIELARFTGRFLLDLRLLRPTASTTMTTLLERQVESQPDAQAIAFEDERYTWREFGERAARYADFFAREGVAKGDVVAILMENRPDFVFAVLGLCRLGAVASLINTNLTGRALLHALTVCSAGRVLVGEEKLDSIEAIGGELEEHDLAKNVLVKLDDGGRPVGGRRVIDDDLETARADAAPRDPSPSVQDVFCYIYTSGTTGLPKAAIIRNTRMLNACLAFGHLMLRATPKDVIYVTLPLYHSSAMFLGFGASLATGASMALRRKFSASAFFDDARRFGATAFIYIGELCRYLLNKPVKEGERDHSIRVAVGNGMRGDVWVPFQERFGIPVVREFYGATEGNTAIINLDGRPGMIGKMRAGQAIVRCDLTTGEPIRNASGFCEPVQPGEKGLLIGRITRVFTYDGYIDKKATDKKVLADVFKKGDRYFDTGDLIQLHEGKWLSFADRAGDTFRWKGENVSTNEVADILDGAPGVSEANVYGVEIPGTDGRAGMAAIPASDDFDLEVFARHVHDELASYQRPLFVRVLQSEMKITGTFKHQKVEYREEGWDLDRVSDPVYALVDGRYVPLDRPLVERVSSGEVVLG